MKEFLQIGMGRHVYLGEGTGDSEHSMWTTAHGIDLTGGAMMALSAALVSLRTIRAGKVAEQTARIQSRHVAWLTIMISVMLWSKVLVGTYVMFPPYRTVPPEGLADLSMYPKAFVQVNPATAWLHSFAM